MVPITTSSATNIFSHIKNLFPVVTEGGLKIIIIAAKAFFCIALAYHVIRSFQNRKITQQLPLERRPKERGVQNNTFHIKPSESPVPPFERRVDETFAHVDEIMFTDSQESLVEIFSNLKEERKEIKRLFEELLKEFYKKYPIPNKLQIGNQVPFYYANTQSGETTNDRRYWSLMGILNMLQYGPEIFQECRNQNFIGGIHHYGHNEGLKKLTSYSGTTVDLDTMLQAKNDKAAIKEAEKLIIDFGKAYCPSKKDLSYKDVFKKFPDRKLDLPKNGKVHDVGLSNTDRSNHGVWKRTDPGNKTFYFANVPKQHLMGYVLRLPYLLAELLWKEKNRNGGKFSDEFLTDLFENGISTQCFNHKVQDLLDFHARWLDTFSENKKTLEGETREKIQNGFYGESVRSKNPDRMLQPYHQHNNSAGYFSRATLLDLFQDLSDNNKNCFARKKRKLKEWIEEVKLPAQNLLIAEGLWENVLYQEEAKSDFFLLDEKSLNIFLPQLFDGII